MLGSTPKAFLNIVGQNMLQNELLLSFLKEETGLKGECFSNLKSIPASDENESSIPQVLILDCKNIDMKNLWTGIQGLNCSNGCRCLCVLCNAMSAITVNDGQVFKLNDVGMEWS